FTAWEGRSVTLTLQIPTELERGLHDAAEREGLTTEAYVTNLLLRSLPPEAKRAAAVALLQSWIDEGDPEEPKETGDFLIKALDEDRPSERKLFPPELEGISW